MDNLIVIKTDLELPHSLLGAIVEATKATVVILPVKCTITSGEDALRELRKYKEVIERFLHEKKVSKNELPE